MKQYKSYMVILKTYVSWVSHDTYVLNSTFPFDLPYMTCYARHIWQVDIDQPKPLM